jgi:hypothetical protein
MQIPGKAAEQVSDAKGKGSLFEQLNNLTPGDFSTVLRRLRVINK